LPKIPKLKLKLPKVTRKPYLPKLPKINPPQHFPTNDFKHPDIPDIKFPSDFGAPAGFGSFNNHHSSAANFKQQYPRLTKPKTYPSHDFKAHQLPDELDSNGGHPNYHPHNGQFTFGQTKELNSFFKDQKKNHNLGNYKNKFGLYNSPDGGSGDIRNTIGNSFHDGRKEETFAFQVFPKLPAFNTFDHDIIDHNLIKIKQNKVADQFKFNYAESHGQHSANNIIAHQSDVADQFKFPGTGRAVNHRDQFKFNNFNKHTPYGQSASASPPKDWSTPIYRDHTMNDGYGDYLETDTGSNSDDVLPESDLNTLNMMNDVLKVPEKAPEQNVEKSVEKRRLFIGDRRSHQHRRRPRPRPRHRMTFLPRPVYKRAHRANPSRRF